MRKKFELTKKNFSDEPEENCEQEMGPEQGGATGNTSLVGTDF